MSEPVLGAGDPDRSRTPGVQDLAGTLAVSLLSVQPHRLSSVLVQREVTATPSYCRDLP